jgi:hypothetical protein
VAAARDAEERRQLGDRDGDTGACLEADSLNLRYDKGTVGKLQLIH